MVADIHLLFEPDAIVPSPFFATVRRQAATKQGEYRLLVAVLGDAIRCFQENAHPRTSGSSGSSTRRRRGSRATAATLSARQRARSPDSPSSTCARSWISTPLISARACSGGVLVWSDADANAHAYPERKFLGKRAAKATRPELPSWHESATDWQAGVDFLKFFSNRPARSNWRWSQVPSDGKGGHPSAGLSRWGDLRNRK
jgi:hypothetical protein